MTAHAVARAGRGILIGRPLRVFDGHVRRIGHYLPGLSEHRCGPTQIKRKALAQAPRLTFATKFEWVETETGNPVGNFA